MFERHMSDEGPSKKIKHDGHSFLTYKEQFGRKDDERYPAQALPAMSLAGRDSAIARVQDYYQALHRAFDLRHGITSHEDFGRHLLPNRELEKIMGEHGPGATQINDLLKIQKEINDEEFKRVERAQKEHAKKTGYKYFGA